MTYVINLILFFFLSFWGLFSFYVCRRQVHIYNTCIRQLIEGCLQGYNATVLAYGQTGSGKTYTMGTGLEADQQSGHLSDTIGILPRSVHHLFTGIEHLREEAVQNGRTPPDFRVQAQFLELYNEEIIDLLEPANRVTNGSSYSIFFFASLHPHRWVRHQSRFIIYCRVPDRI